MKNQYNIQRGILKSVWCLFVWCLCYSFYDSTKFQLKSMTIHFLYPPQKAYLTKLLCSPPKTGISPHEPGQYCASWSRESSCAFKYICGQGRIFLHHHQTHIKALEIPGQPPGWRTKCLSSGLLTSCQGRDCCSAGGTQAGCESRWRRR